jgi:hypothetical protein
MRPTISPLGSIDRHLVDFVFGREKWSSFLAMTNVANVPIGEFGLIVALPESHEAKSTGMFHVLFGTDIFEIVESRIFLIPILMIHYFTPRWISKKRARNELMDRFNGIIFSITEMHLKVSTAISMRLSYLQRTLDASKIGNLIILKMSMNHGLPYFHSPIIAWNGLMYT